MTEPIAPAPAPAPAPGPAPAPVPAKPSVWARLAKAAKKAAKNPALRPFEVWALRAAYAYVAVKLGLAADHAA